MRKNGSGKARREYLARIRRARLVEEAAAQGYSLREFRRVSSGKVFTLPLFPGADRS